MKKILFAVLIGAIGLMSFSCTSKWEYKIVSVPGNEQDTMGAFKPKVFDVSGGSLDSFGEEGWELVGIYEKTETVHPNYGNESYVSGLQPNVRTAEICFVFKRKR
jgi:hypothetical protein